MKIEFHPRNASKEVLGASAVFGAAFLYGWFGILVRLVGESGIGMYVQVVLRAGLASLVLFVIIYLTRSKINIPDRKATLFYVARSLIGLTSFSLSYFAIINESIALGYLFFYAGFLVGGYAIGHFIFHEKFRISKFIALLLAVIGVLQIFMSPIVIRNSIIYLFMAFFAGIFSVGWSSFSKVLPHHKHSQLESNFFDGLVACVAAIILALFLGEKFYVPMDISVLWPQLIFVVQAVVNGQLMIYGFKHVEAQIGSLIMLLEIVFAVLFAMVIFGEVPSVSTVAGCAVIMIASILSVFADKRATAPVPREE